MMCQTDHTFLGPYQLEDDILLCPLEMDGSQSPYMVCDRCLVHSDRVQMEAMAQGGQVHIFMDGICSHEMPFVVTGPEPYDVCKRIRSTTPLPSSRTKQHDRHNKGNRGNRKKKKNQHTLAR